MLPGRVNLQMQKRFSPDFDCYVTQTPRNVSLANLHHLEPSKSGHAGIKSSRRFLASSGGHCWKITDAAHVEEEAAIGTRQLIIFDRRKWTKTHLFWPLSSAKVGFLTWALVIARNVTNVTRAVRTTATRIPCHLLYLVSTYLPFHGAKGSF